VFGILDALIRWDPYLLGLLTFILAYSMINALISENVGEPTTATGRQLLPNAAVNRFSAVL
jgi:hypothetical protein